MAIEERQSEKSSAGDAQSAEARSLCKWPDGPCTCHGLDLVKHMDDVQTGLDAHFLGRLRSLPDGAAS